MTSGLTCDHCGATSALSEVRARITGWHVWEGTTMGGSFRRVELCNVCTATRRPRPPERLDGEVPLFEVTRKAPDRDRR